MRYFRIEKRKEERDIRTLVRLLKPHIRKEVVIVNCSPEYSGIISQRLVHAYFDNPLEMLCFDMPFPGSDFELTYVQYCKEFVSSLDSEKYYIFVDSGVLRGKNFETLSLELQLSSKGLKYIFASLYVQDDSIFTPHVYVEKFSRENDGMLLFWWENVKCTLFGEI